MTTTNRFFSTESELHYCIKLFLVKIEIDIDNKVLDYLFSSNKDIHDPNFIRNQLLKVGVLTKCHTYRNNDVLNPSLYPCLVYSDEHSWLVGSIDSSGEVEFVNSTKRIHTDNLGDNKLVISLAERELSNQSQNILQVIYASFFGEFKELLALSFFISTLTFIVPFYIRILLGVVIPSESITSLIFLALGAIGLIFAFYQLGMKRSRKLSLIASRIEYQISSKVFSKFFTLKYKDLNLDYANKLENMNRNNSQLVRYIRDDLAVALLDIPSLIMYFIVVGFFVGNLVFVPIATLLIATIFIYVTSIHYTSISNVRLRLQNDLSRCAREIIRLLDSIYASNSSWIWLSRLKGYAAESARNANKINTQRITIQAVLDVSTQLVAIMTIYFGAQGIISSGENLNSSLNLLVTIFIIWRLGGSFRFIMRALLKFNASKERYKRLNEFLTESEDNEYLNNQANQNLRLNGFITARNHRVLVKNKSTLNSFGFSGTAKPGELTLITSKEISTTSEVLKSIALLYELTPNTLYFDGYDAMSLPKKQFNQSISYINDKPLFPNQPIYDTLNSLEYRGGEFDLNELLAKLDLSEWISNHDREFVLDPNLQTLQVSKFPKKILFLLSFVEALSSNSSIFLLDDPTKGMCEHFFSKFVQVLDELLIKNKANNTRTIVMGTQNKTLLNMADSLIIIKNNSQCVQGSPKDLRSMSESM